MNATQVLPDELLEDDQKADNISELVGYLIVDRKKHEIKKGETKIGRESSICSIVIENFTISKVHATIESEGKDDTFMYDVGSTNQTKLGKKILKPYCRYKLENNSKITLGNVIAEFIVSNDECLYKNFTTVKPSSVKFDGLDELGDIFDVPTQVSVLQPGISKTSEFEKPLDFQILKVPKLVPSKKNMKLSGCFEEETQCKLYSQEAKSKTIHFNSSCQSSDIFNLNTQFQLYKPPAIQENNCVAEAVVCDDNQINNESDKLKLLLNDGQDDMLCVLMSHSEENNSGLFKNANTENVSQIFNLETQVQIKIKQEMDKEKKKLSEFLQNKYLSKEFPYINKLSTKSTPVNLLQYNLDGSNIFDKNDTSAQHVEEDFIKTQEFNIKNLGITKHNKSISFVQSNYDSEDSQETQPYLAGTLNDISAIEQKNEDEDLIITQAFEILEKGDINKKLITVIPESEELNASKEDFCETQIFQVEWKKLKRLKKNITLETRDSIPDRNFDTTLGFTQKNNKDDFFVINKKTDAGEKERDSERSEGDDDEDFIATQAIEIRKDKSNTNCQDSVTVSRESSPDLLVPETLKIFEDSIKTQTFEGPDRQNFPVVLLEIPKEISSSFPSRFKKETNDYNNLQTEVLETVESSGDETESDLEILLDKSETTKKEGDCSKNTVKLEAKSWESNAYAGSSVAQNNYDSNSSFVFEMEPKSSLEEVRRANVDKNLRPAASESDETDCEEITSSKNLVKEEPAGKSDFQETQVLDSFAEKNSGQNNSISGAESPKLDVENYDQWSSLSLEMPHTQDVEAVIIRISQKEKEKHVLEDIPSKMKTEVGIRVELSDRQVESPLKRPWESNNIEVIPSKKSKTQLLDNLLKTSEKQFSKLEKAHDITQIRPSRTRNSLGKVPKESKTQNDSNHERLTSRRKINPRRESIKKKQGDITPHLSKKVERTSGERQKKKMSLNENSRRNYENASLPNKFLNSRNSRKKNENYFTSPNVIFTGFACKALEKIISDLGGTKTNDLASGKVVVADKVRRTVKFLCAIGLSLPITSPQWLLTCKKEKKFLNPWNFILKDEEAEERWDFELKASLEKSKKLKLFEGFSIFATRSSKPPVKDLLTIVECCGGKPIFDIPNAWPRKTIFVSCLDDKKWWPSEKCKNVKIVHYEFILSGVLRQKIDFKTYTLR